MEDGPATGSGVPGPGQSPGVAAPAQPPAPGQPAFRPLDTRAGPAVVSLIVIAAIDSVVAVAEALQLGALAGFPGTMRIEDRPFRATDAVIGFGGLAQAVGYITVVVLFLRWFHAAYGNLLLLGVDRLRYGKGWAIGAWFVPILNLFRPKQIANDIWRGSDPERPPGSAGWRDRPVSPLLHWWWALWLLMSFLTNTGLRLGLQADTVAQERTATGFDLAADIVSVPTAVLLILVIRRATERQERRVELLTPGAPEGAGSAPPAAQPGPAPVPGTLDTSPEAPRRS